MAWPACSGLTARRRRARDRSGLLMGHADRARGRGDEDRVMAVAEPLQVSSTEQVIVALG